jgi:phospholipid/cholesterol/gamma-HCH transport system ATP-binding protein
MIFQESALFDSMTVREKLPYQLHERGMREEETELCVRQNLGFVGLEAAIDKFPSELSWRNEAPGCDCTGAGRGAGHFVL